MLKYLKKSFELGTVKIEINPIYLSKLMKVFPQLISKYSTK